MTIAVIAEKNYITCLQRLLISSEKHQPSYPYELPKKASYCLNNYSHDIYRNVSADCGYRSTYPRVLWSKDKFVGKFRELSFRTERRES